MCGCLPHAGLDFGDMEELKKNTGTARVKGLPDASITNPSILIKANNEAKLSSKYLRIILRPLKGLFNHVCRRVVTDFIYIINSAGRGCFYSPDSGSCSLVKENENQLAAKLTDKGFLAAGILMALAMVISLFHLGTPGGAYRAIFNLGSSWLSREIFFAGLFFALTVACYYLARKDRFHAFLAWISSLVGLLVIFNMASIYMSTIRPAWTDINTVLAFLGTTFFGAVGSVAFIALGLKGKTCLPWP